MSATAKDVRAAHVPDEIRRWWDTFNNGVTLDEQADEEEPEVDPDSDFEEVEEENAGVAASQSDGKMTHARVEEQISGGRAAARHGDAGCLRAENEMLRLELVHKTKEHEAEQIRRLKLELDLKNKEIKCLERQNEDLRAENENYRKSAKPPRNPRLCRSCNEYVLGHDYRNCPERRASASSEQDEGDDST